MSDTDIAPWEEFTAVDSGPTYTKMKEIRLCQKLSSRAEEAGIPTGNYYLVDNNPDTPVLTDLGKKIKVNILWDTKRLEFYDNGRYEMTSSEYKSNNTPIILYGHPTDDTEEIVAVAPYLNDQNPEMSMKHIKSEVYPKLRVRYYLYALWQSEDAEQPEVVKIAITATDNTGCEKSEYKPLGFSNYAKDSFMGFLSAAKDKNGGKAGMQFLYDVELGVGEAPGKNFVKSFDIGGEIKDKEVLTEALKFVKDHLSARYSAKTSRCLKNTVDKDNLPVAMIEYLIDDPLPMLGYSKMPTSLPGAEEAKTIAAAKEVFEEETPKAEVVEESEKEVKATSPKA